MVKKYDIKQETKRYTSISALVKLFFLYVILSTYSTYFQGTHQTEKGEQKTIILILMKNASVFGNEFYQ